MRPSWWPSTSAPRRTVRPMGVGTAKVTSFMDVLCSCLECPLPDVPHVGATDRRLDAADGTRSPHAGLVIEHQLGNVAAVELLQIDQDVLSLRSVERLERQVVEAV